MKKRTVIPGVDKKLLIKDTAKLLPNPARRLFLRGATSLGALTFLTGCDIIDSDAAWNAEMAFEELPLAHLFVTILQRLGVPGEEFAGYKGALKGV